MKQSLNVKGPGYPGRKENKFLVLVDYDPKGEWIDPLYLPDDLKLWLDNIVDEDNYDFVISSYNNGSNRARLFIWFGDEQTAMLVKLAWC